LSWNHESQLDLQYQYEYRIQAKSNGCTNNEIETGLK